MAKVVAFDLADPDFGPKRAAELYGQSWDAIPAHSRTRWHQEYQACSVNPNDAGGTNMEKAAHQAYNEFLAAQSAAPVAVPPKPEPEPVAVAPKSKK